MAPKNSSRPYHRSRKFQAGVMRVLNRELETKHHRYEIPLTAIGDPGAGSAGFLTQWEGGVNGLGPAGSSQGSLIGNEADQLGVHMRLRLLQADQFNIVRMVVFTPTKGGAKICSDILDAGVATQVNALFMNTAEPLYSTMERELVEKRYMDKTFVLNGHNDRAVRVINKYIKLNSKKLRLQTLPQGAFLSDSPIFICFLSDSSLPSHPSVVGETICYYKDA